MPRTPGSASGEHSDMVVEAGVDPFPAVVRELRRRFESTKRAVRQSLHSHVIKVQQTTRPSISRRNTGRALNPREPHALLPCSLPVERELLGLHRHGDLKPTMASMSEEAAFDKLPRPFQRRSIPTSGRESMLRILALFRLLYSSTGRAETVALYEGSLRGTLFRHTDYMTPVFNGALCDLLHYLLNVKP